MKISSNEKEYCDYLVYEQLYNSFYLQEMDDNKYQLHYDFVYTILKRIESEYPADYEKMVGILEGYCVYKGYSAQFTKIKKSLDIVKCSCGYDNEIDLGNKVEIMRKKCKKCNQPLFIKCTREKCGEWYERSEKKCPHCGYDPINDPIKEREALDERKRQLRESIDNKEWGVVEDLIDKLGDITKDDELMGLITEYEGIQKKINEELDEADRFYEDEMYQEALAICNHIVYEYGDISRNKELLYFIERDQKSKRLKIILEKMETNLDQRNYKFVEDLGKESLLDYPNDEKIKTLMEEATNRRIKEETLHKQILERLESGETEEASILLKQLRESNPYYSDIEILDKRIESIQSSINEASVRIRNLMESCCYYKAVDECEYFLTNRGENKEIRSLYENSKNIVDKVEIIKKEINKEDKEQEYLSYTKIKSICDDCTDANNYLETHRPIAPATIIAKSINGHIHLKIEQQPQVGQIRYRLKREDQQQPGQIKTIEIDSTTYEDYEVMDGHQYIYSVITVRDGYVSNETLSNKIRVTTEVGPISSTCGPDSIRLRISVPKGAVKIHVAASYENSGPWKEICALSNESHELYYTETDIRPSSDRFYRVYAEYIGPEYTNGITIRAHTVNIPERISMTIDENDGRYHVKLSRPVEECRLFISKTLLDDSRPYDYMKEIDQHFREMEVISHGMGDYEFEMKEIMAGWIYPIIILDDVGYYGYPVRFNNLRPVSNVSINKIGEQLRIDYVMPLKSTMVKIIVKYPDGSTEGPVCVERKSYEIQGNHHSMRIRNADSIKVDLYTAYGEDFSEEVVSVEKKLYYELIEYRLEEKRLLMKKSMILTIHSEGKIPGLVLLAWDRNIPRRMGEGEVIERIDAQDCGDLRIEIKQSHLYRYYNLILTEPDKGGHRIIRR